MLETITQYDKIDKQSWSDFVKNHPQGNVFQTPEMYQVYQHANNITPYIVAVIDNGQVVGILLAQWMSNGGKLAQWITSRSIISGGPLAKDNDPAIIDLLLRAYNKLLPIKSTQRFVLYTIATTYSNILELENGHAKDITTSCYRSIKTKRPSTTRCTKSVNAMCRLPSKMD